MTTQQARWAAGTVSAFVGMAAGVGSYTFIYARGASYLTNDPAACANCHVMQQHFDAWLKGSHKNVATCNDCHTPHNYVGKYLTKAINGYNHSLAFTTGHFHEPIQIKARNRAVTEQACRYCHHEIVRAIDMVPAEGPHGGGDAMSCIRCHANVGHMK